MTAEHDNATPIIPGDYASEKPDDVAGLHCGDAHVGRATSPATRAKRRIKQI